MYNKMTFVAKHSFDNSRFTNTLWHLLKPIDCRIEISADGKRFSNAKSLIGLLSTGIKENDTFTVRFISDDYVGVSKEIANSFNLAVQSASRIVE